MRLIDADKLQPDRMTNRGTVAISQSQIANAPTVDVLEQITAEIYEHFMTIDGNVHDTSAIKCMEIIGKYKAESEVRNEDDM